MIYGSVCSGIEAASAAWHSLGWKAAFVSEIEKFPSQVLAHHYPNVPNLGDMTKYKEWPDAAIDVLVGGTPCQSFSVAGLRGGLDDSRGNLMLTYAEIAHRYRPDWLVWENVPGCLSSAGGADFASLLAVLSGRAVVAPAGGWKNTGIVPGVEGAYGLAWRVLDAQYFGVPQRRRRVFVVGCLGGWQRAAAVLLERQSLLRNPPPRREAGKRVAGTVKGGSGSRGYPDPSDGNEGGIVGPLEARHAGGYQSAQSAQSASAGHLVAEVTGTLATNSGPGSHDAGNFTSNQGVDAGFLVAYGGNNTAGSIDVATAVRAKGGTGHGDFDSETFITQAPPLSADADKGDQDTVLAVRTANTSANGHGISEGVAHTLDQAQGPAVAFSMMPMNSGKDFKARETDVAQPVMAAGPSHGNQGGDVIVQPVAFAHQAGGAQTTLGYDQESGTAPTLGRCQTPAIAFDTTQITSKANRSNPQAGDPSHPSHPLAAGAHPPAIAFPIDTQNMTEGHASGGKGYGDHGDPSFTITKGHNHAVAFEARIARNGRGAPSDVVPPLKAQSGQSGKGDAAPLVAGPAMQVRRLTPMECERLQGFPDGYTLIPVGNKMSADGPRYKSLGNSMAVPVMHWIGRRIAFVSKLEGGGK